MDAWALTPFALITYSYMNHLVDGKASDKSESDKSEINIQINVETKRVKDDLPFHRAGYLFIEKASSSGSGLFAVFRWESKTMIVTENSHPKGPALGRCIFACCDYRRQGSPRIILPQKSVNRGGLTFNPPLVFSLFYNSCLALGPFLMAFTIISYNRSQGHGRDRCLLRMGHEKAMLYLMNSFVLDFSLPWLTRIIGTVIDLVQSSKGNLVFRSVPQTLASPSTLPTFKPTGSNGEQAVGLFLLRIRFGKILELKRSARVYGGAAALFSEGKLQQAGSSDDVPVLRGFLCLFLAKYCGKYVSKVAGFLYDARSRFFCLRFCRNGPRNLRQVNPIRSKIAGNRQNNRNASTGLNEPGSLLRNS